jgi:hypothetical protein
VGEIPAMSIKRLLESHWVGFLFLVPFFVLLGVHDALGLSDAASLLRDQRDADSQLFNVAVHRWSCGQVTVH